MRPLAVLHSVRSWLPLTQTWICNQLRFLPSDVASHVACRSVENLEAFPFERIRSLADEALLRRKYYGLLRRLGRRQEFIVRALKESNASVLHSHFGDLAWEDAAAAARARVRHVATFYGYDVNFLVRSDEVWGRRFRELFESIDQVLCEGPHMAECIRNLGCPEKRVKVHRLGIPVESIGFVPRFWKDGQTLRVLIAASFTEKKGIPYALKALARIATEVPIEVTIIGDAHPTESSVKEKEAIISIIRGSDLKDCTRMLGYQNQDVLFREAYGNHIFLSPSITAESGDTEGGAPVSILELGATGMPVISTKHCDIPNCIVDGETGLLAEERDVAGLEKNLRWLIDNPQRWEGMARAFRRQMEKDFDSAKQGVALAKIYRGLVDSHNGL